MANAYDDGCDHSHRWWLNIGAGLGNFHGENYPNEDIKGEGTAQISFNGMLSDHLFLTFATTVINESNNNDAAELALLLGYKDKKPSWYWSASAGVGYLEQRTTNYYYYRNSSYWYSSNRTDETDTLSIPVQGQLFWTPFKHFGIGLIGHASLGKQQLYTGMLGIQFS